MTWRQDFQRSLRQEGARLPTELQVKKVSIKQPQINLGDKFGELLAIVQHGVKDRAVLQDCRPMKLPEMARNVALKPLPTGCSLTPRVNHCCPRDRGDYVVNASTRGGLVTKRNFFFFSTFRTYRHPP